MDITIATPVLKTNSPAKINTCMRHIGKAQKDLVRVIRDVQDGDVLMVRLNVAIETLASEPETANLEPLFKLADEVSAKARHAARAKSEKALAIRFARASELLLRYAPKMFGVEELILDMEDLSKINLAEVKDLQPAFALCDDVFVSVNAFQNGEIVRKIDRTINGWLTAKTGETGRYAEPFAKTEAYIKALAWKVNKPLVGADHREFKAWRNAGYELLKGELDHPWGMCQCGQEKLLPWQDKRTSEWRVSKIGHNCYVAQKDTPSETKPAKHHVAKPGSASKRHKGAKKVKGVLSAKDQAVNAERLDEAAGIAHMGKPNTRQAPREKKSKGKKK